MGIAFAVPINTAKQVIPQLKGDGRVERAYIGITGVTIDDSLDRLNLAAERGVLVQRVEPGSPAARAGVRGGDAEATFDGSPIVLGGDVIQQIDGRRVGSMDDVVELVNARKPGDRLTIGLQREGAEQEVTVTLGERPERAPTR